MMPQNEVTMILFTFIFWSVFFVIGVFYHVIKNNLTDEEKAEARKELKMAKAIIIAVCGHVLRLVAKRLKGRVGKSLQTTALVWHRKAQRIWREVA